MANKAVFLDRDHTLIEDPGYLSDPHAVQLLPGVDLALKSLMAGGFKTVVVTNQAGIARGLLTEETLSQIHAELGRQLAEKGAHLDAIYYCPYHPEGVVEGYSMESDLRKPRPGMLLKAAQEIDIDLAASWMVGDSARDIEAGQRAGCRTIRLRPGASPMPGEVSQEDVQADFTVRNLVDAARLILRESSLGAAPSAAAATGAPPTPPPPEAKAADVAEEPKAAEPVPPTRASQSSKQAEKEKEQEPAAAPLPSAIFPSAPEQTRAEILRYVRQIAQTKEDEFSVTKVLAGIAQVMALLALLLALWRMATDQMDQATLWAQIATMLQVMALTFYLMKR
jgi:D-glycero-D-manno-heptose 1,7-bisphosphate phosphatase